MEKINPLRAFLNGFADDSLEQARKIKIWREGLLGNLDEVNRVQADLEYQRQLARQLKEANPTAFPAGQSLSGLLYADIPESPNPMVWLNKIRQK